MGLHLICKAKAGYTLDFKVVKAEGFCTLQMIKAKSGARKREHTLD